MGLALAAAGVVPSFGDYGSMVAGLLVSVTAIGLIVRAKDAARIAG